MSIDVMSAVWRRGPSDQSERFVLLALADYANDQGECWPSIEGIRQKVCMSERGVQAVLKRLQSKGWLEIDTGGGRKKCNVYRIKTPHQVHPNNGTETPHLDAETPQMSAENPAAGAPEPSLTIIEPSREPSKTRETAASVLCEIADEDAVISFIAYRRKQKGKALSVTAAKRVAKHLRKIFDAGGDPGDALGMAEEMGWQSVEAEWYFRKKAQQNGQPSLSANQARNTGRSSPHDALLRGFQSAADRYDAGGSGSAGGL